MVRITASVAAAVLALTPYALASPVSRSDSPKIKDLVFHDKSAHLSSTSSTKSLPQVITYGLEDLEGVSGTTSTASHLPSGSKNKASSRSKRDIIGEDDRELWTGPETFPGTAVGRFIWGNGNVCSGALVGPRHVLTSKACTPSTGVWGEFFPGFNMTQRHGSSYPTVIVQARREPELCPLVDDWSLIVLNDALGDEVGWFGVKLPEREKLGMPIFTHQGYPHDLDGGQRPYRQEGITVHAGESLTCDEYSQLRTDTDVAAGQSGGPLWELDAAGNYEVWGVLAGGLEGDNGPVNVYASGELMVNTLQKVLADFP